MNVVIVEDDINMRKSLELSLGDYDEFSVKSFKSAGDALKKIAPDTDIIITDINMPGIDGIEFIKALGGKFDVIIMTGNATLNRAIESVRLGVRDFLTKPFDVETLVTAIRRVKTLSQRAPKLKSEPASENIFVCDSPALKKALNIAQKAAATDISVLLSGESGVGKELFAKFIHENSPCKGGEFVAVNMAAIPDNLVESELYGYEKGAFTDASATKKGLFELASGGTLFLDEIGEMPLNLQPKLLRAIQEKQVFRLGASKPISIDVRIISATNLDLEQKVSAGEFRKDLFYRLNALPIVIPPLRERKDEILGIAGDILSKTCAKYGLSAKSFSNDAKNELLAYNYPGNVRELISIVERAAILSDGDEISKNDLFIYSKMSQIRP